VKLALVLSVAIAASVCCLLSCKRDPLNPLDPSNPHTLGKEYACRADSSGIGRVKLTWNTIRQSEVSGYRIYRHKPGENPTAVADADSSPFFDSGLDRGQQYTYYYRIIWSDGREIHKSPEDGVTTFGAPTGLAVRTVARTRIELAWDDLRWLDNYGRCRIYRKHEADFVLYDSASASEYVDSNVQEGVTYYYKVEAVGSDGVVSNQSAETYATPGNSPPQIDSVMPPNPVALWGQSVTITCYAHDPDGDSISYAWEALNGGQISGEGATITFTVPQDSILMHPVRVTVSDGRGQGAPQTVNVLSGIRVTIDNTANAQQLTDYQIKLKLTPSNFDFGLIARPDGGDIRFCTPDGVMLPYWIERWSTTDSSVVWTKVPTIPASATTTIYLTPLCDAGAPNLSDGDSVFVFFDDFEGWGAPGLMDSHDGECTMKPEVSIGHYREEAAEVLYA